MTNDGSIQIGVSLDKNSINIMKTKLSQAVKDGATGKNISGIQKAFQTNVLDKILNATEKHNKKITEKMQDGLTKNVGKGLQKSYENSVTSKIINSNSKMQKQITKDMQDGLTRNVGKGIRPLFDKNVATPLLAKSKTLGENLGKNIGKGIGGSIGGGASSPITKSFTSIFSSIGKIAGGIILGGIVQQGARALGRFGKSVITTGAEYEYNMAGALGIFQGSFGGSDVEFKTQSDILGKTIRKLGLDTKFSAVQVSEASQFYARAGVSIEKTMSSLPVMLKIAETAQVTDLAPITDLFTDIEKVYNITDSLDFANKLTATANITNTTQMGILQSLIQLGSTGMILPNQLDDALVMIGLLGDLGKKGKAGGTRSRNFLRSLAAPQQKKAEYLEEIGFKSTNEKGEVLNFRELFSQLSSYTENMASGEKLETMNKIFNAFDLGDAMSLIGKDEEFKRVEMEIASATSKARLNNLYDIMTDTTTGAMNRFKSAWEGLKIAVFLPNSGFIKEFMDKYTNLIKELAIAIENDDTQAIGNALSKLIKMAGEDMSKAVNVLFKTLESPLIDIASKVGIAIGQALVKALWDTTIGGFGEFVTNLKTDFIYDAIRSISPKLADKYYDVATTGNKNKKEGKITYGGIDVKDIQNDLFNKSNKQGPTIPSSNNFSIPAIPKSYKGASLGNVNVNIINPAFTDPQQTRITTEQITNQFRQVMSGLA